MDAITKLLHRTIGLSAETIGLNTVQRAVERQMAASGFADLAEYLGQLEKSPAEFQRLVEAMVVPETWFFRHTEAFGALLAFAQAGRSARGSRKLRVLSAPCSTGEEPYSVAMALLDGGFAADEFEIHAVDISEHALAKARSAVYGKYSFRSEDTSFRERYFRETKEGFTLEAAVRKTVRFERVNLLADSFHGSGTGYDFVFSRNVLIYFDAETQTRFIGKLRQLLTAEGLLFVGPSEAPLLRPRGFAALPYARAFAFHKAEVPEKSKLTVAGKRSSSAQVPKREPVKPAAKVVVKPAEKMPEKATPDVKAVSLEAVMKLADEQKVTEAIRLAETLVKEQGPSSSSFYLLGVLHGAKGEDDAAAQFYRKALYLEPNHGETLLHLALLLEAKGNREEGKRLRERARRSAK